MLRKHICTLKKSSFDDANQVYMCESQLKVVQFDKIPNEYARGKGWKVVPKSNDALYISSTGQWYFIEFKNGSVQKDDIYRKLYDSLIMLIEMKIIPDFAFCRDKITYILVCKSRDSKKIPDSPGRELTYRYFSSLAKQEKRLFEVDKLEKYLFKETHTFFPDLFEEKFVCPMEEEEFAYNI